MIVVIDQQSVHPLINEGSLAKQKQLFRAGGDFLFPEKLEGINDDWSTCCNRYVIAKYKHAFSGTISCPNKGSIVKSDRVFGDRFSEDE